jgi:hypothetical protein
MVGDGEVAPIDPARALSREPARATTFPAAHAAWKCGWIGKLVAHPGEAFSKTAQSSMPLTMAAKVMESSSPE